MIAFCTTCKDRANHLARTLPQNLADNADYMDLVYVILDYSSPDHLLEYLKSQHADEIGRRRLVVYSFRDAGPFRMAHAKNMAHRLGMMEGADILVNVDADNFTGQGFAKYVSEQFRRRKRQTFLWSRMIRDGPGRLARGISGRIAVSAEAFIKSGGYDEQFRAWSPDDKDFNLRLRRLGCEAVEIDSRYLDAILHNDKIRFKEYRHAKDDGYDFDAVEQSESTVVNFGNVGCGVVYRNFRPDPIGIRPFPTRIFGVGMHKTATTSLHHALETLGYESAHWPTAHWAKAVWDEMMLYGRSTTLEKTYAACDLPIPLLYQQLDHAYPGSKFILTLRNEAQWLESVRQHFSRANPFRHTWDHDPFSHKCHNLVYGRKSFDAETFLERYRRHNREVREYFKGRPHDLLVMDMDQGAGWQELCHFFDRPVPGVAYPHVISTSPA